MLEHPMGSIPTGQYTSALSGVAASTCTTTPSAATDGTPKARSGSGRSIGSALVAGVGEDAVHNLPFFGFSFGPMKTGSSPHPLAAALLKPSPLYVAVQFQIPGLSVA